MRPNEVDALIKLQEGFDYFKKLQAQQTSDKNIYVSALRNVLSVVSQLRRDDNVVTTYIDDLTYTRLVNAFARIDVYREKFREIVRIEHEIRTSLPRFYGGNRIDDKLYDILRPIVEFCRAVRMWLHDEGQYISGIQGLLNKMDVNRRSYPVDFIHSIASMAYVLELLRKHYFLEKEGDKIFPLFKLFDRYRYCMLTTDVNWLLWRDNNERFDERIKASQGFEFAVLNLYDNAVKYLPKGDIDEVFRKIRIIFRHEESFLSVEICSYGPPRNESELALIGSKEGERGDETKNKLYDVSGNGIGAYQTRHYIEKSNFRIRYDSRGKIIMVNGLQYREFCARIEIPRDYIFDECGYSDYEDLD